MEGRALDRHPRQGWAFLVPLLTGAALTGSLDGDLGRVLAVVAGLAAGVAWQLLFRRDLASRLVLPVLAGGAAVLTSIVTGEPVLQGGGSSETAGRLTYFFCVLVGLVLTEQCLRWRDDRVAVTPAAAPATTRGTARR